MAANVAKGRRAPATSTIAPGHAWYLVAALIIGVGWGAMEASLYFRQHAVVDRMIRVVLPGNAELPLAAGVYTIFHEFRSVIDGRTYTVDGISGLLVDLRERTGGAEIMLKSAPGLFYREGDRSARSLFEFEIREAGTYTLATSYSDSRGPLTVLAIARDYVSETATTMRLARMFGFGSLTLAALFAFAIFARQRMTARSIQL